MVSHAHCSSSSSSSSIGGNFDVFLSFRGPDTRNSFISRLYNVLDSERVRTFLDKEELKFGEEIGSGLRTAIKQSRIFIPVFSTDYACSKWCLQELTDILQCYQTDDQIILPIFFHVEPSEVRNQTGNFGEAFRKHEKDFGIDVVKEWRTALRNVGKLKGWHLKEDDGDESKVVTSVVREVLNKLNNTPFIVAEHIIGLNLHVEQLMSLLNVESTDPIFVGICGMGGSGKTTMAKAVYNRIYKNFDGSSFLTSVRQEASTKKGFIRLQQQLLSDILNLDVGDAGRESELIKKRLPAKKALLILDDVGHIFELKKLAGDPSWFGSGSRIIITTRDDKVFKVPHFYSDNIYHIDPLNYEQSLQLFSLHAFSKDQPPADYMHLSCEVVTYAGGLPLTLEVLGSFFCDGRGKDEWESTLQKLKEIPPQEVQKLLKISYDGLDDKEKAVFLDTACLFVGMDKEAAIDIWVGCDLYSKIELEVLIRKSLVKIGDDNRLTMHDRLQDLGRYINYFESPKEPRNRSRLWSPPDILEVLEEYKVTHHKVESIFPISEKWEGRDHVRTQVFAMMPNLRLLKITDVYLEGNIKHLPSSLKWLCWQRCPMEILPSNFYLEKLVGLDLSWSKIRQAWNTAPQNMRFENLRVLNLSNCENLVKTPDFSGFPRLEKLILKGCTALVDGQSIGQLKTLVHLDINGCRTNLIGQFDICMLDSLKKIILSDDCRWGRIP